MSNTLRTIALMDETRTAATISHDSQRPSQEFMASMPRLIGKN